MSKKNTNRGQNAPNVNPQGYSPDDAQPDPKSELEQRAKKKNTRI